MKGGWVAAVFFLLLIVDSGGCEIIDLKLKEPVIFCGGFIPCSDYRDGDCCIHKTLECIKSNPKKCQQEAWTMEGVCTREIAERRFVSEYQRRYAVDACWMSPAGEFIPYGWKMSELHIRFQPRCYPDGPECSFAPGKYACCAYRQGWRCEEDCEQVPVYRKCTSNWNKPSQACDKADGIFHCTQTDRCDHTAECCEFNADQKCQRKDRCEALLPHEKCSARGLASISSCTKPDKQLLFQCPSMNGSGIDYCYNDSDSKCCNLDATSSDAGCSSACNPMDKHPQAGYLYCLNPAMDGTMCQQNGADAKIQYIPFQCIKQHDGSSITEKENCYEYHGCCYLGATNPGCKETNDCERSKDTPWLYCIPDEKNGNLCESEGRVSKLVPEIVFRCPLSLRESEPCSEHHMCCYLGKDDPGCRSPTACNNARRELKWQYCHPELWTGQICSFDGRRAFPVEPAAFKCEKDGRMESCNATHDCCYFGEDGEGLCQPKSVCQASRPWQLCTPKLWHGEVCKGRDGLAFRCPIDGGELKNCGPEHAGGCCYLGRSKSPGCRNETLCQPPASLTWQYCFPDPENAGVCQMDGKDAELTESAAFKCPKQNTIEDCDQDHQCCYLGNSDKAGCKDRDFCRNKKEQNLAWQICTPDKWEGKLCEKNGKAAELVEIERSAAKEERTAGSLLVLIIIQFI